MKNSLSPAAIFGVIGAVVAIAAVALFLGLRDPVPTTKVAPAGNARPAPPPGNDAMPDWALQKLHEGESAAK